MITQFIQSINWVDVALAVLFVRMVFISVSTGFITELFKLLGVFLALIVSLHYFSHLALLTAKKITLPWASWQFLIFMGIAVIVYLSIRFLREGTLMLFKVETTNDGFDKYGAGILSVGRSIILCSMLVFGLLLMSHTYIRQLTVKSQGYKIFAYAGPNTYRFVYDHVIGKLFEKEKFNEAVFAVVAANGSNPK